jgi:hypothetical protein
VNPAELDMAVDPVYPAVDPADLNMAVDPANLMSGATTGAPDCAIPAVFWTIPRVGWVD